MKCSDCAKELRPVVALDIDGTLADWHLHFIHFGEKYLGRELPKHYDGSCEFNEYLQLDKHTYHDMKLAFRAGGFKRWMPAFPGLSRLSSQLRRYDVEVWITTTRPWMRLDNLDPDTRAWLDRNDVLFHGLLYDEMKYSVLCDRVNPERIIGVLDDQHDLFDEAVRLDLPAIFRKTNWNSAIHRAPDASTLYNAEAMLTTRAKDWYSKYD
jgi:hypothetical protein